MNAHHRLFGLYTPGDSVIHRLPVGIKFLLILSVSITPLVVRQLWLSGVLLGATMVLLLLTGLGWRRCFGVLPAIWVMAGLLMAYQLIWGDWQTGAMLVANLILCLYASRVLTLTTPAPVLLDALVVAARPVRLVGGSPEQVGLAAALMLRSIPYLFGSFHDVRQAARARGLERNPFAQVAPVVIGAVAYARATGDALAARGLGED